MSKFAENTTVSAEKSRAEIETLLRKHSIHDIAVMSMQGHSVIAFQRGTVSYRLSIAAINPDAHEFTHTRQNWLRSDSDKERLIAQENRRRWRAMLLVLKGKLVAAADGVVTFEQEFLAYAITADKRTVGEIIIPQLEHGSLEMTQLALPGVPNG